MAKKKIIVEPAEDTQKWLCTFNDLMTLLLTFFVLLLSMSTLQAESVKEIRDRFINALGVMEAGRMEEMTLIDKIFRIEEIGKKLKVFKNLITPDEAGEDENLITESHELDKLIEKFAVLSEEGKSEKEKDPEKFVFNQFREMIRENYREPGLRIIRQQRGLVLRMTDTIAFESAAAELKKEMYPVLDTLAALTGTMNLNLYIEGYTDNTPIKSERFSSNWELSVERAVSVASYLLERGVEPGTIGVSGYGPLKPIASNGTAQGRQKNRRVEIVIMGFKKT